MVEYVLFHTTYQKAADSQNSLFKAAQSWNEQTEWIRDQCLLDTKSF